MFESSHKKTANRGPALGGGICQQSVGGAAANKNYAEYLI